MDADSSHIFLTNVYFNDAAKLEGGTCSWGARRSIDLPGAKLRMAIERESNSGSENAFVFVEEIA